VRVGGRECPGHPSHEPCIRCTTLDWEVYQWTNRALALEDALRVIVGRQVLCPKDQCAPSPQPRRSQSQS